VNVGASIGRTIQKIPTMRLLNRNFSLVIFLGTPLLASSAVLPERLQCEYRENPIGIGETQPRLGWSLADNDPQERNITQSAYQIVVASSSESLDRALGDRWDTGKVASGETQNIVYAGSPLVSDSECWWKVRVWDQAGQPSAWSAKAHWSTGLLGGGEWRAKWIGLDADPRGGETDPQAAQRVRVAGAGWVQAPIPASKLSPLTVFIRRGFTVPPGKTLVRASLLLTPDQVCLITVDGRLAGSTSRWERAEPFDLVRLVHPGANVVGLKIDQLDGYSPAVLGELELIFSDGQIFRSPIDSSWRFSSAASDGWDSPGFSAGGAWQPLQRLRDGQSPWGTPQDATQVLPPAPYFRKEFTLDQPVRKALLHATALGIYEVHLNGERVGSDSFTPGWTDYLHRVPCQTYDVTGLVHPGANAIGAILGDGWYASTLGYIGRRQNYGGFPRFAAQLELELADGTRIEVATDGSWRAATGPIRYADLLQGYAYDARLECPGWDAPGFDAAGWTPVATGLRSSEDGPAGHGPAVSVEAAKTDPVQVFEQLPAKSVRSMGAGIYQVDFGQNMVGWVRLRAQGRSGQRVVLRHGEMLNPNGTLYTSNLRAAAATDFYWLRGGAPEILEPRFTYHGFRYAEISGLDSPPLPSDVTGVVAHSKLERTGQFECSNPMVNRLYENIIWGQKGNYFEAPTDCPQRDERLGWTGDTQFFIPTAAFNFNVASFIERWLVTIATDEQGEDGSFPDIAPSVGRQAKAVTAWGDAAITCTHALWKVYGDTRVITRHFDELLRYMDWLYVDSVDGVVTVGGYGDWLNQGGGAKTEVMDTAYYANLCGIMAEMARAIGRTADAERLTERRQQVVRAFQRAFVSSDGKILESSQTGYALAFTMGLLPDGIRALAAQNFVGEIASHNWHLATGFIGTPRLLPALHAAGRDDVAYRLLLQDTYPSWLFQVKNGATTMWERWDGWTPTDGFESIGMNSFNHYAFGSVGDYLYRVLAGIDSEGPGFRHLVFQPTPGTGLTWARASFGAPSGTISSSWRIAGGKLTVDATFPPNTTASIRIPGIPPGDVGSGNYHWEVSWPLAGAAEAQP
jgi:alpha-L-rhamnosidase